jgi:hypothetical protein
VVLFHTPRELGKPLAGALMLNYPAGRGIRLGIEARLLCRFKIDLASGLALNSSTLAEAKQLLAQARTNQADGFREPNQIKSD